MKKIYISSTYKDLLEERKTTDRAVRSLKHASICMEDYVACDNRPLEKCLQDVRQCDAYIGIFAWRYGHIPKDCKKSITHMEYDEAGIVGIPRLIFLLDENAPWPRNKISKGDDQEHIDAFRTELNKKHITSFRITPFAGFTLSYLKGSKVLD